jgi:glutamate--cysteine ligase
MADDYLDFALAAPAMFLEPRDGRRYASFAYHLDHGATGEDWDAHLTTLFPEVRPRGTYEVRSCDSISPEWYAAPLALYGGIACDLAALRQADELLEGDTASLIRAGDTGLRDPQLAAVARDLVILALDGCDSLGSGFMEDQDVEVAREFFARYTALSRCPADDLQPVMLAP